MYIYMKISNYDILSREPDNVNMNVQIPSRCRFRYNAFDALKMKPCKMNCREASI